jgi:DinB superfamily
MNQELRETLVLLSRTPKALDALLRDLPDALTMRTEGEGTWTAYDVVGHLIHGELTDWIPRTKRLLEFGESKAFDKFDRTAQERESRGKTLGQLLDEFAKLRAKNIQEISGMKLKAEDLERKGMHPSLGTVTLGNLLSTWAAHDMTHLHQVSRILAHQYREQVGPWTVYLGVLQCNGHSS